ncbi:(Na+)-NQR maturation NqrM [Psychromonas sp. CD1]|uniref:(Na+)-NQR maturation NqrM n=1 Tax=Psychromonas sp. CD1 TaxID=1979839 RepID=UPI000B9B6469|nr:(Na+)-NQR maturation NqrM [Psychromonas sp. CD1]
MIYFVATFMVFLVVIVAMSIGYIFNKKTISGSCGGLSSVGIEKECDCPEPCEKRKQKDAESLRLAMLNKEERIL